MTRAGASSGRRLARRAVVLALAAIALAAGVPQLRLHLRAAALLLRFSGSAPPSGLAAYDLHAFDEEDAPFTEGGVTVPARLYRPRGVERPPGLVLVHGVHYLGLNEPRLIHFARVMASAGFAVLTPEVRELADYRVEPHATSTIGASARALRARLGPASAPVGIMGLSFAGGLALLAATDPATAKDVGYVVAVGAHDDLARVLRFFVTDRIERPDGSMLELKAHEYGALVLLYDLPEGFFPAEDVEPARKALRAALKENSAAARPLMEALSPSSRAKLEAIASGHLESLRDELLSVVDHNLPRLEAVSPHGKLGALRVPVLLLHGAQDNVIPASETLWLERELPPGVPRRALVTEAFQHVELHGRPTVRDQMQLVRFIAALLALGR